MSGLDDLRARFDAFMARKLERDRPGMQATNLKELLLVERLREYAQISDEEISQQISALTKFLQDESATRAQQKAAAQEETNKTLKRAMFAYCAVSCAALLCLWAYFGNGVWRMCWPFFCND